LFKFCFTLDKAKGLDIGLQYLKIMQAKQFVRSIATIEKRRLRSAFQNKAKMSDGSAEASRV
jgi:hypothetical protein